MFDAQSQPLPHASCPPDWEIPAHDCLVLNPAAREYCVVIPVIDEGDRIRKQLQNMHTLGIAEVADIIIADGGSSDGSLAAEFLRSCGVHALLTKHGPGKLGAQLRMAYAHALTHGYHGAITIDGNNKDGPEAIPAFVKALQQGVDFVQGSRFISGGEAVNTPWLRHLAIVFVHAPLLSLAAGVRWTDTTNGFRAYSHRLLSDMRLKLFRDAFSSYELLFYLSARAPRLGFKCMELPVRRAYPPGKPPTKISPLRGNLKVLWTLLKTVLGHYTP